MFKRFLSVSVLHTQSFSFVCTLYWGKKVCETYLNFKTIFKGSISKIFSFIYRILCIVADFSLPPLSAVSLVSDCKWLDDLYIYIQLTHTHTREDSTPSPFMKEILPYFSAIGENYFSFWVTDYNAIIWYSGIKAGLLQEIYKDINYISLSIYCICSSSYIYIYIYVYISTAIYLFI